MKAQELRIGNYVECLCEQRQVLGITKLNGISETVRHYVEFKNIVPLKLIHIKPIPLTEEWLLKFGFECQEPANPEHYKLDSYYIIRTETPTIKNIYSFELSYDGYCMVIKHVHQLQNLYFALTSEELIAN